MILAALQFTTLLPYVATGIGTFLAVGLAFRAERRSRIADETAADVRELARADKARTEYIDMLEGQLVILRERTLECEQDMKRVQDRLTVLENSENLCQQERVKLQAENSTLRRRLEQLEATPP